ncbi:bifunctional folylpolyglutamate synthase/dihydrofolate synthase [Sediminicola luteus]|uniref:Dihydrofolate synthase/folylpolyglutamate synthase n=1 Tax=Sediminicola luteus TaxID=319238 RepID=A0A2A4G9E9_9FLAO|nr:folylpolyglutamate synthase/dihydrofolate synthase family protein [Sediminicola luteus]PCE64594.1 tetrahydrofolate synthase [Sediminicola luteus]
MDYKETVTWMFEQLPMYQKEGIQALNAKLDKIKAFARHLGDPQERFKSIHVAGTNGKGSSSHMLASVLQQAGYKVGLYTSPHLSDFRERIKINGTMIPESSVVDFVSRHKSYMEGLGLSFFEMTVAMAFEYFATESVDIAIIEVGLGGRFDATNIITPEVCLITNISKDHTQILGDTLEAIAFEKAGVIKQGVPVVISEYQPKVVQVFKTEAKNKEASSICFASTTVNGVYKTDLMGAYQQQNLKGVVATLKKLEGFEVTEEHLRLGLKNVVANTGLRGRWQVLGEAPKIIADTAHNVEGIMLVIQQVKAQKYRNLHMVIGMVADKEVSKIMGLLPKKAIYYFAQPQIKRAVDTDALLALAVEEKLQGSGYASVVEAFARAKENATSDDLIFVGGSTFTVAEIL